MLKKRFNNGKKSNLFYFRDNIGNEVDLLLDFGTKVRPVELKLGKTVQDDFFKGLRYYQKLNPKNCLKNWLIYGGEKTFARSEADIFSYRSIPS